MNANTGICCMICYPGLSAFPATGVTTAMLSLAAFALLYAPPPRTTLRHGQDGVS